MTQTGHGDEHQRLCADDEEQMLTVASNVPRGRFLIGVRVAIASGLALAVLTMRGSGPFSRVQTKGDVFQTLFEVDMSCLTVASKESGGPGCNFIQDRETCLSSKDGRESHPTHDGFKVLGEACVWCGSEDDSCGVGNGNMCEPHAWLVGKGLYDCTKHTMAQCKATCTVASKESGGPGCNHIQDRETCLSSKDGRESLPTHDGFQVLGEACVWCGSEDDSCGVGNGNKCEPHAWLVGKGLYDCAKHTVAQCKAPCTVASKESGGPGCNHIQDRETCLSSKDGRESLPTHDGFKVLGEVCVWCGSEDDSCGVGNGNKCEPHAWLVGKGLYDSAKHTVAQCEVEESETDKEG